MTSYGEARRNRREICDARGYCGPFINQDVYDKFPDPVWHGSGECVHCCGTRNVAEEEVKQRRAGIVAPELDCPAPPQF